MPDGGPRGLHLEAAAAEKAVLHGDPAGPLLALPIAESVAIMGTLDEIRRQIGVVYPGVDDAPLRGEAR